MRYICWQRPPRCYLRRRAVGKSGAHRALQAALEARIDEAVALPAAFRERLRQTLVRALSFAERVSADATPFSAIATQALRT